ncbi:hypothetical protein, partial [Streptomyces sp. NPDC059003]|uniref:hypothetical protein n=1 Tax=Streptomyces sp. NPDC059003 TaxID=3346691 RepID=UPI0036757BC5
MSFESAQGAAWPQIEQSSMGRGRQFGHIGPVGGAGVDHARLAADDAGLQVGQIGDQAVRTQRSPLVVAGGRLPPSAAAYAFFDAGLGDAVADLLPDRDAEGEDLTVLT